MVHPFATPHQLSQSVVSTSYLPPCTFYHKRTMCLRSLQTKSQHATVDVPRHDLHICRLLIPRFASPMGMQVQLRIARIVKRVFCSSLNRMQTVLLDIKAMTLLTARANIPRMDMRLMPTHHLHPSRKQHRRSLSVHKSKHSQSLSKRFLAHLLAFTSPRRATEQVKYAQEHRNRDDGLLNRGFEFPPRPRMAGPGVGGGNAAQRQDSLFARPLRRLKESYGGSVRKEKA